MPSIGWLSSMASVMERTREIALGSLLGLSLDSHFLGKTLLALREEGEAAFIPLSHLHLFDWRKD